MKVFMLKTLFLTAVLFFGVLFGMQIASKGISNMKGEQEHNLTSPIQVDHNENQKMDVKSVKTEEKPKTIAEKRAKLEEMKSFNLFSALGKNLASFVSQITSSIVQFISNLL